MGENALLNAGHFRASSMRGKLNIQTAGKTAKEETNGKNLQGAIDET